MNNPLAFPNESFNGWGEPEKGMTLRDYFAAKAMQGMLSEPSLRASPEEFATESYKVANAMLKEREKC